MVGVLTWAPADHTWTIPGEVHSKPHLDAPLTMRWETAANTFRIHRQTRNPALERKSRDTPLLQASNTSSSFWGGSESTRNARSSARHQPCSSTSPEAQFRWSRVQQQRQKQMGGAMTTTNHVQILPSCSRRWARHQHNSWNQPTWHGKKDLWAGSVNEKRPNENPCCGWTGAIPVWRIE